MSVKEPYLDEKSHLDLVNFEIQLGFANSMYSLDELMLYLFKGGLYGNATDYYVKENPLNPRHCRHRYPEEIQFEVNYPAAINFETLEVEKDFQKWITKTSTISSDQIAKLEERVKSDWEAKRARFIKDLVGKGELPGDPLANQLETLEGIYQFMEATAILTSDLAQMIFHGYSEQASLRNKEAAKKVLANVSVFDQKMDETQLIFDLIKEELKWIEKETPQKVEWVSSMKTRVKEISELIKTYENDFRPLKKEEVEK